MSKNNVDVVEVDAATITKLSAMNANLHELVGEADRAARLEQGSSLKASFRLWGKACAWSAFLSTVIIMEGFDLVLLASLFAYPPFQRKFGELQPDGTYQLTAAWQAGLINGALVGEILGLFVSGIVAERIGYRPTMIASLSMVAAFIFVVFFAESLVQLLIGEILLGMPWGVFQTLTATYAADVCPVHLRAYLTTYVNLCWVMGQMIASGVLRGMVHRDDVWGYKIPFALQWMWPIPLIIGCIFVPESPWWLIRRQRPQDARAVLVRLTDQAADPSFSVDDQLSMMIHTDSLEAAAEAGAGYRDCFRGADRRRTEIVCGTWAVQMLCGSAFMGYSTYFYQQAGMSVEHSFSLSLVQYSLGCIGTLSSWWLMSRWGRRSIYLSGQLSLMAILGFIGFAALGGRDNIGAQWAIGSLLLLFTFVYDCTVGPVCYALVSEMPATRLRTKTLVLARNAYNIIGLVINIITPRMLNPSAWGWGAKAGFFWAISCLVCSVWTYYRLPEPTGRTYGELDVMFEQNVPARKFASTLVKGLSPNYNDKSSVDRGNDEKAYGEKVSFETIDSWKPSN